MGADNSVVRWEIVLVYRGRSLECKKARFCYTSLNVPNVFRHSGDDARSFVAKSTKCIEDNDKVVWMEFRIKRSYHMRNNSSIRYCLLL
jgi:hypothetical protein